MDGQPVADYQPGQYLGVWLKPEGFPHQRSRQYSSPVSQTGKGYRIAVKREDGGQFPLGCITKRQRGRRFIWLRRRAISLWPLRQIPRDADLSAGVGQTPMPAMLDTLAKSSHSAQVNWFHAAENGDGNAFADEVKNAGCYPAAFHRAIPVSSANGMISTSGPL